ASTLNRVAEHFSRESDVIALLLGGSVAHGFCAVDSDVDVMIVVSDDDHAERLRSVRTGFFSRELCTYDAGYVDGKYISRSLIRDVAAKGSEPARFAFQDARVVFSRDAELPALVEAAARYPVAGKAERIRRFQAQVEAWRWYSSEALKKQSLPLLRTAVAKLSLFAGRIVLAHNELLYPYHKWFLRVLAGAPDKPPGLLEQIEALALSPDAERVERFATLIRSYRGWEIDPIGWGAQFMLDSELNWLHAPPPIDDV
ncbi:MAG TPA: nucleotidyltransferase domain-containing protein, partial [Polyangiaceae bacterium]|nr:nucleotidyltransferase domain-containing protein [Polyangiaceae bacterium]